MFSAAGISVPQDGEDVKTLAQGFDACYISCRFSYRAVGSHSIFLTLGWLHHPNDGP